jgi:hypothetical protein
MLFVRKNKKTHLGTTPAVAVVAVIVAVIDVGVTGWGTAGKHNS